MTHDDLVLLTAYMAQTDWGASEVARAVEKPDTYADQLTEARINLEVSTIPGATA